MKIYLLQLDEFRSVDIADRLNLPRKYVSNILSRLHRMGYLERWRIGRTSKTNGRRLNRGYEYVYRFSDKGLNQVKSIVNVMIVDKSLENVELLKCLPVKDTGIWKLILENLKLTVENLKLKGWIDENFKNIIPIMFNILSLKPHIENLRENFERYYFRSNFYELILLNLFDEKMLREILKARNELEKIYLEMWRNKKINQPHQFTAH